MNATDQLAETDRWLRYAEEDLTTAETLLRQPHVVPRHVCWFAQQAAEKTLKAVLVFLQIDFPRTHDLDVLRNRNGDVSGIYRGRTQCVPQRKSNPSLKAPEGRHVYSRSKPQRGSTQPPPIIW